MNARRRSIRGSAAIEFALASGLLLALLSGAFRLGYSTYIYDELVADIGAAARYAAQANFDKDGTAFATEVRRVAVYGSPSGAGTPLVPGLTEQGLDVTWTRDAKGVPLTITIKLKSFTVDALFQTFRWSGKPCVTVRYAGRYKS